MDVFFDLYEYSNDASSTYCYQLINPFRHADEHSRRAAKIGV